LVFAMKLGAGEAEAITLALERKAAFVLIDDRTARLTAEHVGLVPLGVLGILIRAKHKGLISTVGPAIERLVREMDFTVSDRLLQHTLREAGEGPGTATSS